MHPNLAEHLHTPECNKLIEEYKLCIEQNKYKRYFGTCSAIQIKMEKCIQNELVNRRNQGLVNRKKEDLEYYTKKNPELAEKLKLYEKLKAEQQQQQQQK